MKDITLLAELTLLRRQREQLWKQLDAQVEYASTLLAHVRALEAELELYKGREGNGFA